MPRGRKKTVVVENSAPAENKKLQEEAAAKDDEIQKRVARIRNLFADEESISREGLSICVPTNADDDGYREMPLDIMLAAFRKQNPEWRITMELEANAVRCRLYVTRAIEAIPVCEGYGDLTPDKVPFPLAVAERRALRHALNMAGYGISPWECYQFAAAAADMIDDTSTARKITEELRQRVAEVTTEKEDKEDFQLPPVDGFMSDVDIDVEEPMKPEPAAADAAAPASVEEKVPSEAQTLDKDLWKNIPENGLTAEQISKYVGKISLEDAKSCVVPFGAKAGSTLGEIFDSGCGKAIRFFAKAGQTEGTKLRLACLKFIEAGAL